MRLRPQAERDALDIGPKLRRQRRPHQPRQTGTRCPGDLLRTWIGIVTDGGAEHRRDLLGRISAEPDITGERRLHARAWNRGNVGSLAQPLQKQLEPMFRDSEQHCGLVGEVPIRCCVRYARSASNLSKCQCLRALRLQRGQGYGEDTHAVGISVASLVATGGLSAQAAVAPSLVAWTVAAVMLSCWK